MRVVVLEGHVGEESNVGNLGECELNVRCTWLCRLGVDLVAHGALHMLDREFLLRLLRPDGRERLHLSINLILFLTTMFHF